jgi:hypothetical protein
MGCAVLLHMLNIQMRQGLRVGLRVWALFLVLLPGVATAQFADKGQLRGGLSLEFVPVSFPEGQDFFLSDQLFYGIVFGGEYTLAHANDFVAVNLDASATVSFNYNNVYGTQLFLQGPVYLVGKIGAGATPYNESLLGLSVGVGAAYTFVNLPYSIDQNATVVLRLKPSWLAPSAMVQLTLKTNAARYSLRGHVNLSTFTEVDGFAGSLRYENYGFGLVYSFD